MLLLLSLACDAPDEPVQDTGTPGVEVGEELSGGETTVFDTTAAAFSLSARNLDDADRRSDFFVGNSFFNDNWVTAPSSTTARDGLGPLYNAKSCSSCHFKDGRGRPPLSAEEPMATMLLRLSIPGEDSHGGPVPDPNYGGQLQPASIDDVPTEGTPLVTWTEIPGSYADGEAYSLRQPTYEIADLSYGDLHADLMISPRVAPFMIGLGLLEAIDEAEIRAWADPDDADGDGISGRVNEVWDAEAGAEALGRFGWKANQPSLRQQAAGAYQGDLGITTPVFGTQECSAVEIDCAAAIGGGEPEAEEGILARVVFYGSTLAVPARRDWTAAEVVEGKQLFGVAGCDGCHLPKVVTGTLAELPEVSGQTIRPYTDLLLHDMGPGLADERPDFLADGQEWRTPPLWGLGLVPVVNDHDLLLHDGRARGFAEAILWHGGEAQESRDLFVEMSADERAALLAFLGSM